jgi:GAF domain-containing protein
LNDTASNALHNASLLIAERKVEILETLNAVSHEITSTLNLERMLQTIVNAPQAVIPYDRAVLALEQKGRFKLSAVTGLTQVNTDAPEIAPLMKSCSGLPFPKRLSMCGSERTSRTLIASKLARNSKNILQSPVCAVFTPSLSVTIPAV